MKIILNTGVFLALCLVVLSAQIPSNPAAGIGAAPATIPKFGQNLTVRFQGNLVNPNIPIDITFTTAATSNLLTINVHQVGEVTLADGRVQPIVETDTIAFRNGSLDSVDGCLVDCQVSFSIPQAQSKVTLSKGYSGSVLIKKGQTIKVVDTPGQGSLQVTLQPSTE